MTDARAPWCLVDRASAATSALAVALREAWGPGICYLWGVHWVPERGAVLPTSSTELLVDAAQTCWWWSDDGAFDTPRALAAAARGCVPFQAMPTPKATAARAALPDPLRPLVVDFGTGQIPGLPAAPALAELLDAAQTLGPAVKAASGQP